MKNSIASKLETSSMCHSDCIISMCLPMKSNQHLTLFTVYVPTLMANPTVKHCLYADLHKDLNNTPANDKVLWPGKESLVGVVGCGVVNCDDIRHLLLEVCTECQLTITNTTFQHNDRLKTTWMHHWSKQWHLLDYVLVHQHDLKDVLHTRVMPSAECCSDHHLVRCKFKQRSKPKLKKAKMFNIRNLRWKNVKVKFQADLELKLIISPCNGNPAPDTLCDNLKTFADALGYTKKKNRDWFDK